MRKMSEMSKSVIDVPFDALGSFKERPNRFLAIFDIELPDGKVLTDQMVHVHDPGRLKELLFQGNRGLLRKVPPGKRKTQWDLLAARARDEWVFIHSAYHRRISEWVLKDPTVSPFGELEGFKAEVNVGGHSRIDFVLTKKDGSKVALEVKGCSLAIDGVALFPDAPTERGTRHIRTLMELKKKGMDAAVMILVFRPEAKCFAPKEDTDPVFAETFYQAKKMGLGVYPLLFRYDEKSMNIMYIDEIPVCER